MVSRLLLQEIKKSLRQTRYAGIEHRHEDGADEQALNQDAGASASSS